MYHVLDIRTDIRPTVAEIDLVALRDNAALLADRVAPARVMAVIKADAYGHGAVACARALQPLVWGFAVSLVEEGVELRRSGIEAPIVLLGGFYGRSHQDVVAYQLTPVVWELGDLERFARAADELAAERVAVHLKVDTGMSRLGVRPAAFAELCAAVQRIPGVAVTGLCTHLAEADGVDEGPTREQLARFDEARGIADAAGFRRRIDHVANSAGAIRFPAARHHLVRPGVALLGVLPSREVVFPGLRPVMRLATRIVTLRDLPPGAGVSYGALFRARRPSRIATIPIGYADGYTRRMTGRAEVLVGGRRCPVVGAITMDMAMVDVTEVPARQGDEVVLLGSQGDAVISVDELADWAGTVAYETFCSISKRVPRVYKTGSKSEKWIDGRP